MTDDENKERADLFGESSAAKPLFSADESLPQGKPLFHNDFDDTGDAEFVKPLFSEDEEEEKVTLEDFREYDDIPDADEIEFDDESGSSELAEESVKEELPPVETDPVQVDDPIAEPTAAGLFTESAAQEISPAANNVYLPQEEISEPPCTISVAPVILTGELEAMPLGALMAYARETAGLSAEDVYNGTKINEKYLYAIEQEDFEKLPSGSFPGAYVRALCSFYRLDKNAKEIAQKKASAYCTACRPPDDVYDQLNEHAIINKEEQARFKKIVAAAGVILFSLILSIITVVVIVTAKKKAPETAPAVSPVTVETLEKLSPEPPQIKASELDVPR